MKPLTPAEARRLIDRGLRLWDEHPCARSVTWREGRRVFRLHATNFRVLLDMRWYGRPGWTPAACRWD